VSKVVVERCFAEPVNFEAYAAGAREAAWCFDLYRVDWIGSYIGIEPATRMICIFEAPDAEAVRQVGRRLEVPHERLWTATEYAAHGTVASRVTAHGCPVLLAERSAGEPVDLEDHRALEDAANACLGIHRIRIARSYVALDRRRMISIYEAPDTESVRLAQRRADLPFEYVWSANFLSSQEASAA
jgi:hypothetical protein